MQIKYKCTLCSCKCVIEYPSEYKPVGCPNVETMPHARGTIDDAKDWQVEDAPEATSRLQALFGKYAELNNYDREALKAVSEFVLWAALQIKADD